MTGSSAGNISDLDASGFARGRIEGGTVGEATAGVFTGGIFGLLLHVAAAKDLFSSSGRC